MQGRDFFISSIQRKPPFILQPPVPNFIEIHAFGHGSLYSDGLKVRFHVPYLVILTQRPRPIHRVILAAE